MGEAKHAKFFVEIGGKLNKSGFIKASFLYNINYSLITTKVGYS
ncbi:hypothetical protein HMPREF0526_10969 [Lactobacillus jensenii JV-V16]|nr:hypothetical protein HMPREF0526_10969 [Lactobacillus jensenii JV-V16]